VLIECPECRHVIRIVDRRPGRFHPRCPKCAAVFELVVPTREHEDVTVSSMAGTGPQISSEPDPPSLTPGEEETPVAEPGRRAGFRPAWLPRGVPRILGGYFLLRLLGHGPRGRAFLARPISLDAPAVLKVLAADRARDRVFRARHVREAFAAAQVRHPNLIAIREVDAHRGHHYAAVEWVGGPSLDEVLHASGKIEPGRAAVMILQAARGLRAAHRQGLWHRDVKPANLRIDSNGLVRVDDLGLEMTPSLASALEADATGKGASPLDAGAPASVARAAGEPPASLPAVVGTPSFMAPEQAGDPLAADGRADVYALGGTFYDLVTGRPPFPGETAIELIRGHAEDPLIPPGEFVPGLPRKISEVIQTMMGKRPDERYPSMDVVVDVLEGLLGLRTDAAAKALADAGESARQAAETLASSPARKLRNGVLLMAGAIWVVFSLFLIFVGLGSVALVVFALGAMTALFVTASAELAHGSELSRLFRVAMLGSGLRTWIILGLLTIVVAALLWSLGGCLPWFLLICAGGLAAGFHVSLERPLAAEREKTLGEVREIVRRLRRRGHDDERLREVIAGQGSRWQRFLLEGLFGLDAVRAARSTRGGDSQSHVAIRLPSWRDATIDWLEKRIEARRDRRHLRILEAAEEGRLEAQGINLMTARRKARRIARALMLSAAEWRDEMRLLAPYGGAAPRGFALTERLRRAAAAPEPVLEPHESHPGALRRRTDALGNVLFGRGLRLLLGTVLLAVLACWLDSRGIVTWPQVRDQAGEIAATVGNAVSTADPALLRELKWNIPLDQSVLREPVDFPWLPEGPWKGIQASNVIVAALILLASTIAGRKGVGLAALAAAAIALFGAQFGVELPVLSRRFGIDAHAQARALSLLIGLLGFLIPRRRPAS
jgi:serine/threonine protein kinase